MRLRLLTVLGLTLLHFSSFAQRYLEMIDSGTYPLAAIQKEAEAYFDVVGRGQGSGYKPFKRWEYVALMELDDTGVKIPNFELAKRARDYRRAERQQRSQSSGFGGDWKQLGPTYSIASSSWSPGLGRITSIGIDVNNLNHLIVGSPTGGVWKSTTGGNSWTPISDEFSSIDIYALEISPYNNQQYLWGSTGGKIFRSLDGGASWTTTGNLTGGGKVSRIQYHPTDPDIVYAVSESNGLFRSTNKGSTWTAVAGVSGMVGYDVEFKPGDPNTIYFSGISVYRSTNGGSSFSQIGGFGTANNNYKRMGVSPANPNVVYVLEAQGGKFGGFYKSNDSGASYNKLIAGDTINYLGYSEIGDDDKGQAPRNMDIAVHPLNANQVHIGGVHTWKSINGGVSFELSSYWVPGTAAALGVGYNHADIDILKFAGNNLLVGTDGGFFISTDEAASFEDHSSGLSIKELYKIGVSKSNPNVVTGGSQDNGTMVMRGANRAFLDWLGADGMETFVDWNNANILYGTSQYGSMYRSTNQGSSRSDISKPLDTDGAWVTPFEQDPQVSTTIYVAFADVWKSTDSGDSWEQISTFDNGNMSQMKLAPSDNQRIYLARGSSLFTTANGGTTWTTTASGWGTNSISYIAVHPQNPQRLVVVTSSNVYHSMDAGATWTTIGAGLPSGAKYCATWENTGKNGIYVGGFGYVSYTNDDLAGQWVGFFDGLPNARVYELEINYLSNTIFAGSYGRGLWESQLYKPLAPLAAFSADKHEACGTLTVNFTDESLYSPTAWAWTFEGGTPATSTLQHPTVTFNGNGAYIVRLKSSNSIGESIVEALDTIYLFRPSVPFVLDADRCEPGEITLEAIGKPGDHIHWYASAADNAPLFNGETFKTNISQTTTFYATASTDYVTTGRVGPIANDIGDGANHAGDRLIYLDAIKPFLLKSATVYASGAADRTFQLRNASGTVLLQKTVFIDDGEQRITLDMDIPQGNDLRLTCISPANLFRNSSGVSYPYSLPGVMQIKGSSGGQGYYYYLYDMEVESVDACESDRVPVTGVVNTAPAAPIVSAAGPTTLCPGESVILTAENVCPTCAVKWSNGETGLSINASVEGSYTATVSNTLNTCGDSPVSNTINVTEKTIPSTPIVSASDATLLCSGASVVLTVENVCLDCTVHWSNAETGSSISVSTEDTYTATLSNVCGESSISNAIAITTGNTPAAATIEASGVPILCPGESVVLTASDVCPDCSVNWSNGEAGLSITVSTAGVYTAIVNNICGDSPASNAIAVTANTIPAPAIVIASGSTVLCPGESVVLTAENICFDCTVHWSNGETGSSIAVSTEGVYAATLSNACGDSPASNGLNVTANTMPDAAMVSVSGPTALCPGESVLLIAENVCPDCIVLWSNGETGPSITISTDGVYTATLSNVCGDSPISNPISVTTNPSPAAAIVSASGLTALCPGESVVLTAENICPDCTLLWSNGQTGQSITVSTGGTYTATLSNLCGESPASNSITVVSQFLPDPPVIDHDGTWPLCPGDSVVLSVENVCADCLIKWSNGETGQSITVSTYAILTATMINTCGESPVSNSITVIPLFLPDSPVIAPSGTSILCPGESLWLSVVTPLCFGCTVNWSNGATGESTSVSAPGVYTATVQDPNNPFCGDTQPSNAITIEVYPPFLPELQVTNLCDLAAPIGSGYHWFVNGVLIPDATGQFWSAEVAGNYVVTMNNSEGCAGTSEPVFAEACMSSTHDMANILTAKLYPNPTQDQIFLDIQLVAAANVRLELFAADGRYLGQLFQREITPGRQILEIELPELPAGMYRYRLATETGSLNGNLVVQRR